MEGERERAGKEGVKETARGRNREKEMDRERDR